MFSSLNWVLFTHRMPEEKTPPTLVALLQQHHFQVATSCTVRPHFSKLSGTFAAATAPTHPPVTRLETTRGKMSIFSILIRISPGKAMIKTTSGGRGDMCRSSIPEMEPRNTPEPVRNNKSITTRGETLSRRDAKP